MRGVDQTKFLRNFIAKRHLDRGGGVKDNKSEGLNEQFYYGLHISEVYSGSIDKV